MTGGAGAPGAPGPLAPPAGGAPAPFGVYVHFPYCAHRCPYCDFAVSTAPVPGGGRYARAVLAELAARAPAFDGRRAVSLYLGGGTPSRWDPTEVAEVIAGIRARVGLPADAEVTIEANPESCAPARLRALREAGANRLSIGVQSFDPRVLARLGRRHDGDAAARAIAAAAVAIGNVSVDLIHAGLGSSPAVAAADAARAVALGAVHVSAYALTLDPEVMAEEVPLARAARRLAFPGDDEALAQGRALRAALRRGGLRRYEISNHARPGRESVHNQLYWAGESYLGLGAGAAGCERGAAGSVRWQNLRDADAYLAAVEAGRLPTAEEDRFDARADRAERLALALRTVAGAPLELVAASRRGELPALLHARLAVLRRGRVVLTARGMDVQTAVAARLVE